MSEPAGIVITYGGSTAPDGWLLCDGSAVSRTTYATLYDVIGTTYGTGDGSTTFNVPNLQGRVVIGVSGTHALASTGGEATHVLTEQELPTHSHNVPAHGHAHTIAAKTPSLSHTITQPVFKYNKAGTTTLGNGSGEDGYISTNTPNASRSANVAISNHSASNCTMSGSVTACAAFDTSSSGSNTAHNNMQPYLVLKYFISVGE